jgi:hypothetical protein
MHPLWANQKEPRSSSTITFPLHVALRRETVAVALCHYAPHSVAIEFSSLTLQREGHTATVS